MIRITSEQLKVLGQPMRQGFMERLRKHAEAHFPDACAALGEQTLQALLDELVDRAEDHGFDREGDIKSFVSLAFVFGRRFDTELDWARDALSVEAPSHERIEILYGLGDDRADEGEGLG